MEQQESEVEVETCNVCAEDNVAAETTVVETELSNPVGMDEVEHAIVPHSEHRVETTMEELECEDEDVQNVNEEEGKGEEHEPGEEEEAYEPEENGGDEDEINGEFAAEEDGDGDDYGDDDEDEDDNGDEDGFGYDYYDSDVNLDYGDDDLIEEGGEVEKENGGYEDETNNKSTAGEESKKEKTEEKGLESSGPKLKKIKNKHGMKNVVNGELVKLTSEGEAKSEAGEQNGPIVKEDEKNAKVEIEEKGEGSANKNVKKLRTRNRRKVNKTNTEKVASISEDKLKLLGRKKVSKRAESMGMIFMCSSKTKKDCYRYNVFGLPAGKRDIVEKVYKGMRLFLYDFDLKLMHGIYKAAGPGGYNIEPKAFKSQFPSQVRFSVMEDCIPLAEEKFKKVIQENYFTKTKFDCQLKAEQVKKLCELFVAASEGPGSNRTDRGFKERSHAARGRDRHRPRGAARGRDRHRPRGINQGRSSALDEKDQYLDYPLNRQREAIAPLPAPVYRVAPLRRPAAAPLYVTYDRILETDAYRQNLLLERHDSYRQPLLESRDAYRREPYRPPLLDSRYAYRRESHRQPPLEPGDAYRQDPLLGHGDSSSRDGAVDHRDLRPLNYVLYGKRQSYRDPVYVEDPSPERDHYLPVGRRYSYRSRDEPLTEEYRSVRARYRY